MAKRLPVLFLCLVLLVMAGCDDESRPSVQGGGLPPGVSVTVDDHSRRDTYYVLQITANVTVRIPKPW